MKNITEETRNNIIELIKYGYEDENTTYRISWNGKLRCVDFLTPLYDLNNMETSSFDFYNAKTEILYNTDKLSLWDSDWIFDDHRFQLTSGNDDSYFLKFLCRIFHPNVRDEKEKWKKFLDFINEILKSDGYEIFEEKKIFGRTVYNYRLIDRIEINAPTNPTYAELKSIGEGSYAKVSKYKDERYDKYFAVKSANCNLDEKELKRFKREFADMKKLNSPYVVEVYAYDDEKNRYTMELMDCTLKHYIDKNNDTLQFNQRRKLVFQLFNAFSYIHSKDLLHRDVSPNNILIKEYDDVVILKISDFGLVKETTSDLTSDGTDFKGSFNDQSLKFEGFNNYSLLHEIYALTLLVVYIMTGKTNTNKVKDTQMKNFLMKGINSDKTKRFQSLDEMKNEFSTITNL